jgi:hypothetical protein
MPARWIPFNPSGLVPEGIVEVAETAQSTAETLATGVRVLADATRVAALFAQNFTDLNKALIEETKQLIYTAVQQLVQTGVYWTFYIPGAFTQRMPPSRWLRDVAYSFDDRMDPERPILPTRGFVGAIVLMGSNESYGSLIENFRALFALFRKFIAPVEQTMYWQTPGTPWDIQPGVGLAPNWGNMTLGDLVPPIGDLVRVLLGFADQISAAESNMLDRYAAFLDAKADNLIAIAEKIEEILLQLAALLDIDGVWLLPIYGEFNSQDIQQILTTTEGGPMENTTHRYSAGCMFLSTGGTSAEALFNMFGIAAEITDFEAQSEAAVEGAL